jgi:hypothetical protein
MWVYKGQNGNGNVQVLHDPHDPEGQAFHVKKHWSGSIFINLKFLHLDEHHVMADADGNDWYDRAQPGWLLEKQLKDLFEDIAKELTDFAQGYQKKKTRNKAAINLVRDGEPESDRARGLETAPAPLGRSETSFLEPTVEEELVEAEPHKDKEEGEEHEKGEGAEKVPPAKKPREEVSAGPAVLELLPDTEECPTRGTFIHYAEVHDGSLAGQRPRTA